MASDQHSLSADLARSLESGHLSDCTIECGSEVFKVHKLVLSCRSPVFAAMFRPDNKMLEASNNTVKITDVSVDVIRSMLQYMYTGSTAYSIDTEDLFSVADRYEIEGLKEQCEIALHRSVSIDNVCQRLQFAELHSMEALKTKAIFVIAEQPADVFRCEDWQALEKANKDLAFEVIKRALLGRPSGVSQFIPVMHDDSFPRNAVKALDRLLEGGDEQTQQAYVALWYKNGEAVFGRAINVNGKLEAWFPYGGEEYHSAAVGPFEMLICDYHATFDYVWISNSNLAQHATCIPLNVGGYVSCVLEVSGTSDDDHDLTFYGEILGKADLSRGMAWCSWEGREHFFTGEPYRAAKILCKKPI